MKERIKLANPIVEMDGDEMTRILWAKIKERLLAPYIDLALEYYDLGIKHRDETDDAVTAEAARAIRRHKVGVKCATITPDANRVVEYGLKKAWASPNATIRGMLDGTVFRKPIIVSTIKPAVRSWVEPIVIGRHAYGDLYKAVDCVVDKPGKVELVYSPADGSGEVRLPVFEFRDDSGVVLGMHNTDRSIRSFALSCVRYALSERIELWFGAKDTISKRYHGRFREIFAEVVAAHAAEFAAAGISYRYLLIDDVISQMMRHRGGLLWACMNFDGDVFSDMVAAGFGSLGMMSSVLVSPDGCFEYEAAHGTVKQHYYDHMAGKPTSTNSVATIFAWAGAIRKRGELDGNPGAMEFANKLERAVLDTVESGFVTGDLLGLVDPPAKAKASTDEFIGAAAEKLERSL